MYKVYTNIVDLYYYVLISLFGRDCKTKVYAIVGEGVRAHVRNGSVPRISSTCTQRCFSFSMNAVE